MEEYSLKTLIRLFGGDPGVFTGLDPDRMIREIVTDSRTIRDGDVFFALKGKTYDGADFAENALKKGAVMAVVNRDATRGRMFSGPVLAVDDTLLALGVVAKDYRKRFTVKTVAVTGTSGKTTVKDMAIMILAKRHPVHGTPGNYNNFIGVPLSVFGLTTRHRWAVFELGMSAPGEIRYLADLTQPDVGVILNVGPGHIEFFKSLGEIAAAKMELLDALPSDGTAVINADDEFLKTAERRTHARIIGFGVKNRCEYRAENVELRQDGCVSFTVEGNRIDLNVPGLHNVYNALAAYAIGSIADVRGSDAAAALRSFTAPNMRMQSFIKNGIRFIDDSYNANPLSMRAAAEVLRHIGGKRRIAVLGDMLELGKEAETAHEEIGGLFGSIGLDLLCLVGNMAGGYRKGAVQSGMKAGSVWTFGDKNEAAEFIDRAKRPGDVILVKGSRALGLETIIHSLSGVD